MADSKHIRITLDADGVALIAVMFTEGVNMEGVTAWDETWAGVRRAFPSYDLGDPDDLKALRRLGVEYDEDWGL